MKTEATTGLIGSILISGFLLGLANSINKTPFWCIIILVLIGIWIAWYQDAWKNTEN